MEHVNFRVRVILQDSRMFIGILKAFDKFMNLILADCEEFRILESVRPIEESRTLGFIILRGHNVVSITVEGPPPLENEVPKVPVTSKFGSGAKLFAEKGMPLTTTMSVSNPPTAFMDMNDGQLLATNFPSPMIPPLPPTIGNMQPPMCGIGRDGLPPTSTMGIGGLVIKSGGSQNEEAPMSGVTQGRPPIRPRLLPTIRDEQPPMPGISQDGQPPMLTMGKCKSPTKPVIGQNGQSSMSGVAQGGPPPMPEIGLMGPPLLIPPLSKSNKRRFLRK
ncbi:small nuclear ribonucleoprotein-associated protein B-like isoform X2 [Melanaphis sacchari]|nr:small nuclear ribonucleoprotein-associated protein B-like isoform X2 [Melanaphis sacchari]XP_025208277.1 small nuclear ribonucleoprotein-associated protein B-like isoform X2 [Melanaphis sacchari]XP_025208278.1 small nuclear ribonucleoprotein-associated protein B-like isoform X2 [Melanaphis sacchari]